MDTDTTLRLVKTSLLCWLLLLCSACAQLGPFTQASKTAPDYLFEDKGQFGEAPAIVKHEELFQLTTQQSAEFLDYMNDPRIAHQPKYQRVFNFLEQSTRNFNYRGKTHLARDVMDLKQGNCMSLAILTTALAKTVGVRVAYQLIDTTPVFDIGESAVAKGVHVRSKLYRTDFEKKQNTYISLFGGSGIVVDYFPSKTRRFLGNISEDNFIARYYRNLAVEYLQNSDFNNGYWYALEAMKYAPHDEEGINLMAVIYKRAGYIHEAEEIYKHGISVADGELSLLKNYRQLLIELGRREEANQLGKQIAGIEDPSPYNWLHVADSMLAEGNYNAAINYYKRAVDLAPYLQFGYLGLAKAYYFEGRYSRSESMLEKAIERNYDSENDPFYQAKLAVLTSRRDTNN